jgi:hypothetical protein
MVQLMRSLHSITNWREIKTGPARLMAAAALDSTTASAQAPIGRGILRTIR